jgi:1,4-dihydroxy-2-naphthoate octaprenyltransferase
VVGSGLVFVRVMLVVLLLMLVLVVIFVGLFVVHVGVEFVWIGVVGVICVVGYMVLLFLFVYRGFGEVFVFVFFGLLVVVGMRVVCDGSWIMVVLVCGVVFGAIGVCLFVTNNLCDCVGDVVSGKCMFVVCFGECVVCLEIVVVHGAVLVFLVVVVFVFGLLWGVLLVLVVVALFVLVFAMILRGCDGVAFNANFVVFGVLLFLYGVVFVFGLYFDWGAR